jgi:hypothetical protein
MSSTFTFIWLDVVLGTDGQKNASIGLYSGPKWFPVIAGSNQPPITPGLCHSRSACRIVGLDRSHLGQFVPHFSVTAVPKV